MLRRESHLLAWARESRFPSCRSYPCCLLTGPPWRSFAYLPVVWLTSDLSRTVHICYAINRICVLLLGKVYSLHIVPFYIPCLLDLLRGHLHTFPSSDWPRTYLELFIYATQSITYACFSSGKYIPFILFLSIFLAYLTSLEVICIPSRRLIDLQPI